MNMIIQIAQAMLIVGAAIIVICIATVCLYVLVIAIESIIEERRKKKGKE